MMRALVVTMVWLVALLLGLLWLNAHLSFGQAVVGGMIWSVMVTALALSEGGTDAR